MERKRSILEGFIAGFSFGSAAIIIRLLEGVNAYTIAVMRLIIASLALIVISMIRADLSELFKFRAELIPLGAFLGLHLVFFIMSVKDTSVMNATVLVNTAPILTMIIGVSLFKIRASIEDVMLVLMAFSGALMIAYPDLSHEGKLIGDLEAIISALLESIYLNLGSKFRRKTDPISLMIPVFILAAFTASIAAHLTGTSLRLPLEIRTIALILALGLIPTAIGHTLYFSSLKGLRSFETATMALLEPISASIIAVFLFGEIPSLWSVAGSALTLSAVFLVSLRKL
ncbi:hypothetical protein DRN86_02910 [Candidatus Geothermarchaeota archaeon]|nr:MAG: hypothetical protein DRN86_02910 [Candidatus Geothermarchaeota archaeon]